jgi:drug/metabolite transporter (DMT)-like permease
MNQALREADTSLVMSLDFVRLVWVSLIGFVVFAEVPGVYTWIGGIMICGGVLLTYRDPRRTARKGTT